jgi:5-methylcytosine-specific restriction endonuclease McrBC GTP-binding regulatory subunit McrB
MARVIGAAKVIVPVSVDYGQNLKDAMEEAIAERDGVVSVAEEAHDVERLLGGKNMIFYGVPGCGKSYKIKDEYCDDEQYMERVVFHPEYTNADFIGQILPVVTAGHISYEFTPGPFTRILKAAVKDPSNFYYLVIEEINRGNAPAIFGEVFQLLDRVNGESEYGISNADIAKELYGKIDKKIKIPSNLYILATMNTADQNVFVLDSAFKRRFSEEYTGIDFSKLTKELKEATSVFNGTTDLQQLFANTNLKNFIDKLAANGELNRDWPTFAKIVNYIIDDINEESGSEQISEDKKLGPFFVSVKDLENRKNFINKVLHYLKQDVFKYVDFYFTESYQTIHAKYIKETADIFNLLKRQGE